MTDKEILETLVSKYEDEVMGSCGYANAACELHKAEKHDEAKAMYEMAETELSHAKQIHEMIITHVSEHIDKYKTASGVR